jgi:predicted nucleic acid-binding protein
VESLRRVFADTVYWVATALLDDQWSAAARTARGALGSAHLVTTEEVLIESLAMLASRGPRIRAQAVSITYSILNDRNITVLPQTHVSFLAGLRLYARRLDKNYSLVDCIAMNAMRGRRIREVLTNDRHFHQEGFAVLIPNP